MKNMNSMTHISTNINADLMFNCEDLLVTSPTYPNLVTVLKNIYYQGRYTRKST